MSDVWIENGPFTAVLVGPNGSFIRLPSQVDLEEAKKDLTCFNRRCQCNNPKNSPRPTGCKRDHPRQPHDYLDYIDNGNGFRALPYKV